MRRFARILMAGLLVTAGCVVRPPPIKSAPTAADPSGAPVCTMADGIDPNGHPSCSEGCTWDVKLRQCGPEAKPAPAPPIVPPNGV